MCRDVYLRSSIVWIVFCIIVKINIDFVFDELGNYLIIITINNNYY